MSDITDKEKEEIRQYNNDIGNGIGRRLETTENIVFEKMPKEYERINIIEYYLYCGLHPIKGAVTNERRLSYKQIVRLKNGKRYSVFFLQLKDPESKELYYYKEIKTGGKG